MRLVDVHPGYGWLALDIYEQMRKIIQTQFADKHKPVESVVITGHSLGASVAAQVLLMTSYFKESDFTNITVAGLLFAQPRSVQAKAGDDTGRISSDDSEAVVSKEMVEAVRTVVLDIHNTEDPVVAASRLMYYRLGSSAKFKPDLTVSSCYVNNYLRVNTTSLQDIRHGHDHNMYKAYIFDQYLASGKSTSCVWEPNAHKCSLCHAKIGKSHCRLRVCRLQCEVNRRHHCRNCGKCVCGKCSLKTIDIPGMPGPQRVCNPCGGVSQPSSAEMDAAT
jgi:hypothetical protein